MSWREYEPATSQHHERYGVWVSCEKNSKSQHKPIIVIRIYPDVLEKAEILTEGSAVRVFFGEGEHVGKLRIETDRSAKLKLRRETKLKTYALYVRVRHPDFREKFPYRNVQYTVNAPDRITLDLGTDGGAS